ncbi:predicted protein [Lichtheimia corymbifera JMRC:FSU:9682]|uniref:Uncharacterized protein n=1 Tax=Lichtheimia corymbifera JMRC:FSU:9682 TaxID=1263082 RepID=A0A068RTT0_9FUNG|nr:predicted protein [Lichtheimia corymbifera JMRC:FSU:9682]
MTGVLCINMLGVQWVWVDGCNQSQWYVILKCRFDYYVVSGMDGSCCVNSAEDGDGLDGMDEKAYILTKGGFRPWMVLDVGAKARTAASFHSWMDMFTAVATNDDDTHRFSVIHQASFWNERQDRNLKAGKQIG